MQRLPLIVIFLLCIGLAYGQDTHFSQLTEENGLPQNFVYGIVKDKRGFIWISTGNGLARFDGEVTKVFTQRDGLASNFITTSLLSKSGRLLFGHFQGSISSYNGAFFETIIGDTLNSEIVSIAETNGGILFAATRSSGLITWRDDMETPAFLFPAELQGKIVNQIKIVGNQLITATSEGIYTFQIDNQRLVFNDAPKELMYEDITSLETFKNDSLQFWAGTSGNGLFLLRTGTFTKVTQHVFTPALVGTNVSDIVHENSESLWLGTYQKGLVHLTLENDSIVKKTEHFDETTGYPLFSVNTIYIERPGTIWVGSLSNGLIKIFESRFKHFSTQGTGISKLYGVAGDDDRYFVGTDLGLFQFDPTAENTRRPFIPIPAFSRDPVTSVRFLNNAVWVGTYNKGVQIYYPDKNSIRSLESLKNTRARLFEVAPDGSMWIATMGDGVIHVNQQGEILHHFTTKSGFIHNDIFAICADAKGNVWFGSLGAGLAMLDGNGVLHRLSQEDVFPSHDINAITEHKGIVWIATDGQGYFKFENDQFTHVGPAIESGSPFIKSILVNNNRLWMSMRKDIGYLDLVSGKSRYYDQHDGLSEKGGYAAPLYIDSKNNLLLINDNGITFFNTAKVEMPVILNTYLTGISISFKPYTPPAPTASEIINALYPSVVLDHDQNHLTFDFKAIDTNFGGQVYYRYYLEKLEKEWSPPSSNPSVTYTSLEPGKYIFHAQATNDLRAWVDPSLTYSFIIKKPYWNSWWFYILQITGIVVLFGTTLLLIRNPVAKRSLARIMVFMCLFIVFDYLQNWLEPITPEFIGSVPLYKTMMNLCLALLLLLLERGVRMYFKKHKGRKTIEE